MKFSAIVSAVLAIALSFIAAPVLAQSAQSPVPLPFSLTVAGQASQLFALSAGQSTCSVVVTNSAIGQNLIPQATSNSIADVQSNTAQWTAVTSINSGAITAFGLYTGNVANTGLTFFRVIESTSVVTPVTGSIVCSNALGLGAGGGGGAAGSVTGPGTSGTLAQAVQGITGGVPVAISGNITSSSSYPFLGISPQAQPTAGAYIGEGCTYNSGGITAPTTTQFVPCQSDVSGNEKVAIATALPAGTNGIGSITCTAGCYQPFPYPVTSSAPIANSFLGISGFDGTNVRPVTIDPTTGAVLTKSAASVNGTYGAPNATVTASATSVQYEQGTGPNGSIVAPFPGNADASTAGVGQNIGLSAYNGASFDRLRTAQAFQSPAPIGVAAVDTCGYNTVTSSNTCSGQLQNTSDAIATQQLSDTAAFLYGFGNGGFDRIRTVQNVMTSATGAGRLATGICDPSASSCATVASGALAVSLGATPQPVSGTVAITGAPTPIAYTSAAPIPATIVNQPASYPITSATTLPVSLASLPALTAGSATIGSIANTAFGITGSLPAGSNNIGSVTDVFPYSLATGAQTGAANSAVGVLGQYNSTALTLTNGQVAPLQEDANGYLNVDVKVGGGGGSSSYPYSTVPFPVATQTPSANTAVGISCPVATPTSAPTGGVIPITCSATNGGINLAPATLGAPYSLVTQGQTAQAGSGLGVLGVYNSTLPTLTTGQAAPLQLASNGSLNVTQTNAIQPYSSAYSQTATTASFVGIAGYASTGSTVNPAYVDTNGIQRHATCSSTASLCAGVGSGGTAYVTVGGSATFALTASATAQVVKSSAGRLVKLLVTTAGTTGATTCYDNASAASGTVIAVVPSAAAAGTIYDLQMPAANGITCSTGATGNVLTASYY